MLGKKKCRILKEIRQKIADENDIPYVTHECKFQGECKGTCPRCESELNASPFANDKGGDKSGTEDLAGMMDEPDEVYVTTGEVAPPEDTGEEGQEGSTSQGGSTSQEGSTGKEDVSCQGNTSGKEDVSGQGSTSGKEVPEEIELTGDVAYFEEDVAP